MKNYRQHVSILGGLTVLTAALFAQSTPSSSGSAQSSGSSSSSSSTATPDRSDTATPGAPDQPGAPTNPYMDPSKPAVGTNGSDGSNGTNGSTGINGTNGTRGTNDTNGSTSGTNRSPSDRSSTSDISSSTGAMNHTGSMTSEVFTRVDTDGDGRISSSEYSSYQSRQGMNSAAGSMNSATPPAKRCFWSRMFHGEDKAGTTATDKTTGNTGSMGNTEQPTFIELDTNHDGYLSQTEISAQGSWSK